MSELSEDRLVEIAAGRWSGALGILLETRGTHLVVKLVETDQPDNIGQSVMVARHLCAFVPTPSEIRRRAAECRRARSRAKMPITAAALDEVRRLIAEGYSCYAACRRVAHARRLNLNTLYDQRPLV